MVINFSHNMLSLLPNDFALNLKSLRYIDVAHNKLQKLPDGLGELQDLRKLFVSFNLLHELPHSIGECRRLQKLRVVSNYIRDMPRTIIKLWDKHPVPELRGCLE